MASNSNTPFASSRRRFLASSGLALVGVAVLGGGLAGCSGTATSGAANFSASQFDLLTQLSDMLIPATDTPGALGAGVPDFVQRMMHEWAMASTRENITAALTLLDDRALDAKGGSFVSLSNADREAVLEDYERLCFAEKPDKAMGGKTKDNGKAEPDAFSGYRDLKMLVYRGYYWSEIGCTQELQYELIPGPDARADAPMAEIGRSWAL
jgi:hypothetical protein